MIETGDISAVYITNFLPQFGYKKRNSTRSSIICFIVAKIDLRFKFLRVNALLVQFLVNGPKLVPQSSSKFSRVQTYSQNYFNGALTSKPDLKHCDIFYPPLKHDRDREGGYISC